MHQITQSPIPQGLETLQHIYSKPQSNHWRSDSAHQPYYQEIRDTLLYDQDNLCIYCEKLVDQSSNHGHIEHFNPRDKAPGLTFTWDNLMLSCDTPDTCGTKKGSHSSPDLLHPYKEPVEDFLKFNPLTGEIEPNQNSPLQTQTRAKYTIDLLGLDQYGLVSDRQNILRTISQNLEIMHDYPEAIANYLEQILKEDKPFITARKQLLERLGY